MSNDKADLAKKYLDLYGINYYFTRYESLYKSLSEPDKITPLWQELPGLLNYDQIKIDLTDEENRNTLFCYTDFLSVCYYVIKLDKSYIFIGPVAFSRMSDNNLDEITSIPGISQNSIDLFTNYLTSLPLLDKQSTFTSLIDMASGEIFDNNISNFVNRKFTRELVLKRTRVSMQADPVPDDLINMNYIEERYRNENQLLIAVSEGNEKEALAHLAKMQRYYIPSRISNTFQDGRNMCISFNTLLRKTIEQAGVHPYYIDRISSSIVRQIYEATNRDQLNNILADATSEYCSICREYITRNYSPTISKLVTYIGTHLGDDLSLSALAELFNMNASHLSTSFKKETGQTLTDYVNSARVTYAQRLLLSTTMEIKDIATACGIPDTNYFARIFKKKCDETPASYRKSHSASQYANL